MVVIPALLPFDVLLVRAAVAALAVVGAWSLLVILSIGAESLTGGKVRGALALGCPPTTHRWLLGLLGGAVVLGALTNPASATSAAAPPVTTAATAGEQATATHGRIDGLPLPDRPREIPPRLAGSDPAAGGRDAEPRSGSSTVWVRKGQSLWTISRELLRAPARNQQTAVLARAIYLRNRVIIGKDPDLIRPGQQLSIPSPAAPSPSEDS